MSDLNYTVRQSMETFPRYAGAMLTLPATMNGRMAAGRTERGMTRRVEGKVALVTGAANGIGRSAALMLAREGANIVATDLQDERARAWCANCAPWLRVRYYHHDVTREDDWQSIVARHAAASAGSTFSSTMPGSGCRAQ